MGGGNNPGTSRSSQYRQKMKNRYPEKFKELRELNKIRSKERRDKLKYEASKRKPTPSAIEKLNIQREKAALRQNKFREKKKVLNRTASITSPLSNRPAIRERNKLYKRKERENHTSQKKAWIRKKDREDRRSFGDKDKLTSPGYATKKSEYNACSKVRNALPTDAQKYAIVIHNLTYKCSPRKRAALSKHTHSKRRSLADDLQASIVNESKPVLKRIAARLLEQRKASKRRLCRFLHIGRNTNLKTRKRKHIAMYNREQIIAFYKREDISRTMPQKRYATKNGPGYLLQHSILGAFKKYKKIHIYEQISYSTFAKLRPTNVRLLSPKYREYCVCVYCVNIRYKVLTLSRHACTTQKYKHEEELYDNLLCSKSSQMRFHNLNCIEGKCDTCKDHRKRLYDLYKFNDTTLNEMTVWCSWQKSRDDKGVRRVLKATKGSVRDLMNELVGDLIEPVKGVSFFQHLFTAKWQQHQFINLKSNLPEDHIIQIMDFAKNRQTKYNDEIKSAFYQSIL